MLICERGFLFLKKIPGRYRFNILGLSHLNPVISISLKFLACKLSLCKVGCGTNLCGIIKLLPSRTV